MMHLRAKGNYIHTYEPVADHRSILSSELDEDFPLVVATSYFPPDRCKALYVNPQRG
jgi:hypothetical protein